MDIRKFRKYYLNKKRGTIWKRITTVDKYKNLALKTMRNLEVIKDVNLSDEDIGDCIKMNIIDKIIASGNEDLIDLAIGIYKNTDTLRAMDILDLPIREKLEIILDVIERNKDK